MPGPVPRDRLHHGPRMGDGGGGSPHITQEEDVNSYDYIFSRYNELMEQHLTGDEQVEDVLRALEPHAANDPQLRQAIQAQREAFGLTGRTTTGESISPDLRFIPEREYQRWDDYKRLNKEPEPRIRRPHEMPAQRSSAMMFAPDRSR